MSQAPTDRFAAWSPSRLRDYELCPRQAFLKSVKKICTVCWKGMIKGGFGKPVKCTACGHEFEAEGDSNPSNERGNQIHAAIREYISGRSEEWYDELNAVAHLLDEYREKYKEGTVRLEYELGLTKDWKATGFFDDDVWLRLKLDLVEFSKDSRMATVIDWKSGRYKSADEIKGAYDDALSLYSVGVLSLGLTSAVESKLVFTDYGEVVNRPRGRLDISGLYDAQLYWEQRSLPLMEDRMFSPLPGMHCKRCAYSCSKGGPCEF